MIYCSFFEEFHREMLVAGYCDYNVQRCPIYTRNICDLHSDVLRSVKLPCMNFVKYTFIFAVGVDSNAWIAFKCMFFFIPTSSINLVVDIVSELTVLCNAIAEFCTESSCPMMRAGPFYEYAWADPILFPSPTMLSAPKYMELLLNWVDSELCKELDDESFIPQVKVFSRRLFRVYAHLFTEHIPDITTIMFHLRYSLYHFMIFAKEFDLGISESETNSIKSIVESFKL